MHPGEFYALPQSPQLFKQILMVAGTDRYFQIVKCFRDEDLRADRQPEFTQIDVEMSFATRELVFATIEPLIRDIFRTIGREITIPFPRMSYADAIAKYGSDKPDLRVGMAIADLSAHLRGVDVQRLPRRRGRRRRGPRLRRARAARRIRASSSTTLNEQARALGAGGLVWARRSADAVQSSALKAAGEAAIAAALDHGRGGARQTCC